MTDEQVAAKIITEAQYAGQLNDVVSYTDLRAAIVRAIRAARQPVAHEVPGFHVTQMDGWGRVTTREAGLVVRTKGATLPEQTSPT